MNDKQFANFKSQILGSIDLSKKGEIDGKIANLVQLINNQTCYVTLSSCSGRTIVVSQDDGVKKKGCEWIYTTHGDVSLDEFVPCCIHSSAKNLILKFESFILHIGCQTLLDAKKLLNCALNCGYRNSGIVPGSRGKITIAVRSTLNLEVPLSNSKTLFTDKNYLEFLAETANSKMCKNHSQIQKFEKELATLFTG